MTCWMSCKRGGACCRRYRRTTVKAEPAPDPAQRRAAPALLHDTLYACVQVISTAGVHSNLPASCLPNLPPHLAKALIKGGAEAPAVDGVPQASCM